MAAKISNYIAERKLLFSPKNSSVKTEFIFKISSPYIVQQENVDFPVDGVAAGCHVAIEGLEESGFEIYGMDSLQAVNLASNIEPWLHRFSNKYDFYWRTGEPYFDE